MALQLEYLKDLKRYNMPLANQLLSSCNIKKKEKLLGARDSFNVIVKEKHTSFFSSNIQYCDCTLTSTSPKLLPLFYSSFQEKLLSHADQNKSTVATISQTIPLFHSLPPSPSLPADECHAGSNMQGLLQITIKA